MHMACSQEWIEKTKTTQLIKTTTQNKVMTGAQKTRKMVAVTTVMTIEMTTRNKNDG